MPKVTYISHKGDRLTVDINEGFSVMEGAVSNGVDNIEAVCGGACACATCHVYVEGGWLEKLDPKSEEEAAMLDFASGVQPNSRLSCQIIVSTGLDGLVVSVPDQI